MTTTTGETIANLMATIARDADVAGGNVYGVRAWPTQADQLPSVQLELPDEDKVSAGPHGPQEYRVTASIPVVFKVTAPAEEDEEGAATAKAALGDLVRAFEVAVIGHPDLYAAGISHFPFVHVRGRLDASGREILGQRVLIIGAEFFQDGRDFWQPTPDDIEAVDISLQTAEGANARLVVDLEP